MAIAEARPAASVIILRDAGDAGKGDRAGEGIEILFVRRAKELRFMGGAWVFPGGAVSAEDGDPEDDVTYRRCGVRETFEEAHIELGAPLDLVPFSRWITPELVPMRFDTRFYLAASPAGAEPTPDRHEVDLAEWWSPAKAIDLFVTNAAELHFPTIKQVEQLTGFAGVSEALNAYRGVPVEPVLPRVAATDDGFEVLLPGDPGYADAG